MKTFLFSAANLCIIVSAIPANAQPDLSKYELGVFGSSLIYQGDLAPARTGSYRTLQPGFGFLINRRLNSSYSIRLNFLRAKLLGDDSKFALPVWRRFRNFKFSSPVTEITGMIVWHPLEWMNSERIKNFSPYIFGGAGISILNISRDYSNFNPSHFPNENIAADLAIDLQHRLPRLTAVVPVGAGIKYPINDKLSIFGESSYRVLFTDYLDGFSKAANPQKKDHYHSHSVGIIYQFGKKKNLDCPPVK